MSGREASLPFPEPERTILSVSELTRDIKRQLEGTFYNLWVAGEISNLKRPPSGHTYFTLKDDKAQLPAVMFRSSSRSVRFRLQDGMAVLVWGRLTVYEPRGAYQIAVERIEPRGKGALQLAFEQLKSKLEKDGIFDPARKRPLPLLPQRIGIVTSPSGAAIRDICRVLHRRYPNLEVLVYPAQVQGELAGADIAKGIQVLNRLGGFDVLIVTRGGGSLEDLWPFNEESVARAIAASAIPVMSAVGHETDVSIADFAADVRAPTPSAAAELVVRNKDEFLERLASHERSLERLLVSRLRELGGRLERLSSHRAFAAVLHGLELKGQRLDEASYRARSLVERRVGRLERGLRALTVRLEATRVDRKLTERKSLLSALTARLSAAERTRVDRAQRETGELVAKLEAMSPLSVLGRGYSLAWSEQGKLLRRAAQAAAGDCVVVELSEGKLRCRVEASIPPGEPRDVERDAQRDAERERDR